MNRPVSSSSGRVSLAAFLAGLVLLSGCSYLADSERYGRGAGELTVTGFDPTPGATDVAVNAILDVHFDVAPAGESVTAYSVQMFSGVMEAPGEVRVDQIDARVRFVPAGSLRPQLRYTLYVEEGIRGLDGSVLAEPAVVDFTTGTRRLDPEPPRDPVDAEQVQPLWQRYCTSCHAGDSARAGVDLGSTTASLRSLRNAASLGSALPRVRPGDHSRSYLTRKLLGTFGFQGFPMPPSEPRLSGAELRQVADWIDAGAD